MLLVQPSHVEHVFLHNFFLRLFVQKFYTSYNFYFLKIFHCMFQPIRSVFIGCLKLVVDTSVRLLSWLPSLIFNAHVYSTGRIVKKTHSTTQQAEEPVKAKMHS
jgi:hypothetical protein